MRLYAESAVSDQMMLSASLDEAESRPRHWEKEAKEGIEKVARVEEERDAARYEASIVGMDGNAVGRATVKVESELGGVQYALVVLEEAR